jgi:DNA polymerase-1
MIDRYYRAYPGVREYLDRIGAEAHETGMPSRCSGASATSPSSTPPTSTCAHFGERTAMNHPMQGSAADIIKIAMIRVEQRLRWRGSSPAWSCRCTTNSTSSARMRRPARVEKILAEEMENAVSLSVPMIADAKSGQSWYAAKG